MKLPDPVAWMDRDGDVYRETPELSRAPHQKLFTEAQLREALAQQKSNMGNSHITQCQCKDRPASECPGAWEPDCDLGNNEAHAVPVNQCDGCMAGQAMRGGLHVGDDGKPLMVCQKSKYEAENAANERNLCLLTDDLAESRREVAQLQEQNRWLDEKLALYERVRSKPDQGVEEIMGLAFKMAGMVQHVKHAPDGRERRQQAVDELEQAITNLDNIASELQSTCDRQAVKLGHQEAVMRQVLDLLGPTAPECSGCAYEWNAAIKSLEDALK